MITCRIRSKVKIEIHNSKLSGEEYLAKLPTSVIVLDEGGEEMTSIGFSKKFENWIISTDDVHSQSAQMVPQGTQSNQYHYQRPFHMNLLRFY